MMEKRTLYFLLGLVVGVILGMAIFYKLEVDTINKALEYTRFCYEKYALGVVD